MVNCDGVDRSWWQFDQSPLMARGFRNADAIVTLSDFDRDYALKEGYQPAEKVVTATPGLHPAFLGLPFSEKRAPTIGYVGNWLPRKGTAAISAALPEVLRAFPSARLLIVGAGRDFCAADWLPPDILAQVEVVPWVDGRAELIKQYQRMSIALMPSFYESFGLVAAEAMACSAAVISSRTGFGSEITDGHQGLVLESRAAHSLATACKRLLADEPLRQRLAASGHQLIQSMTWESSIVQLEQTYLRWIEARRTTQTT
jgi:glycosyltransferase involved in cell wall biosynthesis